MTPTDRHLGRLPFTEITFAIPAQKFGVTCAVSTEETLPVVTEFAIRLVYIASRIKPAQLQQFFGFSDNETAAVVKTLLDERLVRWDDEQLGLTTYALDKFIASSDKIPRCFKIRDWSSEVYFDLIGFSPIRRQGSGRSRAFVELRPTDADKESNTVHWAERALIQHFREICRLEKAEIYKISEVDPGERLNLPLNCTFTVSLDGQGDVSRSFSDLALEQNKELAESISDVLGSATLKSSDGLWELLRVFQTDFKTHFDDRRKLDVSSYLDHVHVLGKNPWGAGTSPVLGQLWLSENSNQLIQRLKLSPEVPDARGRIGFNRRPICWLAPDVSFWGRARAARTLLLKINRLLRAPDDSPDEEAPEEHPELLPEVRVLLPPGRLMDPKSVMAYRDSLPGAISLSQNVLDGNVEIFWVPDRFVYVLYHFFGDHAIPVPFGFVSSEKQHLEAAERIILGEAIGDTSVFELGTKAGAKGPERTQEFALLRSTDSDSSIERL